MRKKLLISFSGGETSAYMTWWLLNHWEDRDNWEIIVVFSNTGQENEETLKFVELCDREWGFNVIWIEAVPRVSLWGKIVEMCNSVFVQAWIGGRIGTTFKQVSYLKANREGKPFEAVIQKYGIPNMATPHCTRELKENPIKAYAKSIGWQKYYTAIGIRSDEIDRINKKRKAKRIIYPLIEFKSMTKQKINFWWSVQRFRLNLKGYQGNCITCWKKSDPKLYQIANENPRAFDFMGIMDLKYGKYIPESRLSKITARGDLITYPVTFFRKNRTTEQILKESESFDGNVIDDSLETNNDDERCEVFSQCSDN